MILNKLCLVALFSACYILSAVVYADDCDGTPTNLGLCQEFQLIRNLAPHDSIISLIKAHMNNDIRFHKAVQYMLSSQFQKTTAKIDATATYQSFLRPFTSAGVNTTDIDGVAKIFDCVIIPVIKEGIGSTRTSFYSQNIPESRSLSTVVQDVVNLIPKDALYNTLKAQVAANAQFAKFYGVIRNPTFRSNVLQGFNNRDISGSIKQLRRQQIDLCELVKYSFKLFDLGPAV